MALERLWDDLYGLELAWRMWKVIRGVAAFMEQNGKMWPFLGPRNVSRTCIKDYNQDLIGCLSKNGSKMSKQVRWVRVLDMQVTLHDKRIVMQVSLHYEATVMQVTLHYKRIVISLRIFLEQIIASIKGYRGGRLLGSLWDEFYRLELAWRMWKVVCGAAAFMEQKGKMWPFLGPRNVSRFMMDKDQEMGHSLETSLVLGFRVLN
nr:hypothetical protein [Tanacetum cinerariifolium]